MIAASGITISALGAFGKKLDVSANNIANVLTDGFKKSRASMVENENGGVRAVVDRIETQGMPKETVSNGQIETVESSNVDLNEELPELIPTRAGYSANAKTLKVQEAMLGTLMDILS